jgi:hypothetical protein
MSFDALNKYRKALVAGLGVVLLVANQLLTAGAVIPPNVSVWITAFVTVITPVATFLASNAAATDLGELVDSVKRVEEFLKGSSAGSKTGSITVPVVPNITGQDLAWHQQTAPTTTPPATTPSG